MSIYKILINRESGANRPTDWIVIGSENEFSYQLGLEMLAGL